MIGLKFVWPSRIHGSPHLSTRQYARIVRGWVAKGLLVSQGEEAYVARTWQLSAATEELIQTAVEAGLGYMIRDDHPLRNVQVLETISEIHRANS